MTDTAPAASAAPAPPLGFEAEPGDAHALVAHLDDVTDTLELYARASADQVLFAAAANEAAAYRARACARLHAEGLSYAKIAELTGLGTRARAQQLVERGRR